MDNCSVELFDVCDHYISVLTNYDLYYAKNRHQNRCRFETKIYIVNTKNAEYKI